MIVIAAATVRLSSQHVCNVELPFVTEKRDSSHLWMCQSKDRGKLALVKCFSTDKVMPMGLNHKECQGVQHIVAAVSATK